VTEQTAKVAAEQHAAELARMTGAIEAERTRHLQEAEQLRAESVEQKKVNLGVASERDQVRADLAAITAKAEAIEQARQEQRQAAELEAGSAGERLAKAEVGQEKAHQEASAAREEAANLRGQVEAMKTQVAELMQVLATHTVSWWISYTAGAIFGARSDLGYATKNCPQAAATSFPADVWTFNLACEAAICVTAKSILSISRKGLLLQKL